MKKLLVIAILVLFTKPIIAQEDWETFKGNDYTISFPDDWTFDKTGQMGTTLILFSPLKENDTFSENVNLIIQDLTGYDLDLASYTELSLDQMKQILSDYESLSSTTITRDGKQFQKVMYTENVDGRDLKFEQYYLIKNNKAYVITLTCEIGQFENYKLIGEKILNSFTLTDK